MDIELVEARGAKVPVPMFVASWITLLTQHGAPSVVDFAEPILVGAEAVTLDHQITRGKGKSLDVLLRCLAPRPLMNTMMATKRTLEANAQVITVTTERPKRAAPSTLAWKVWNALPMTEQNTQLRNAIVAIRMSLK